MLRWNVLRLWRYHESVQTVVSVSLRHIVFSTQVILFLTTECMASDVRRDAWYTQLSRVQVFDRSKSWPFWSLETRMRCGTAWQALLRTQPLLTMLNLYEHGWATTAGEPLVGVTRTSSKRTFRRTVVHPARERFN